MPTRALAALIALDTSGTERWRVVATGGRGSVQGIVAQPDGRVWVTGPYTNTLSWSGSVTPAARGGTDVFLSRLTQ